MNDSNLKHGKYECYFKNESAAVKQLESYSDLQSLLQNMHRLF